MGGIPLIARITYQLRKLEIQEMVILAATKTPVINVDKWQGNMKVQQVRVGENADARAVALPLTSPDSAFLYVDAKHLIDYRLLEALASCDSGALVFKDTTDRENHVVRLGLLRKQDLTVWLECGSAALVQRVHPLYPEDIDPFCDEIRGPLVPYLLEVCDSQEARDATWTLIRSQQKHVMDLPAEYLDPPFENALTYFFTKTPVTPNMVTLLGVLVALSIAWLFWHGYFATGALLTFLVEILDGVDGKLARTKLQYSKIGEHEYIADYFCENSWYVALGVGLGGALSDTMPYLFASLLIISDTVDNILYTMAGKWYGKSIDLFSPFDAFFRRIGGRRNIYSMMFIVGFMLGYPYQTFAVAGVWAAITAVVHAVRLIQYGKSEKMVPLQAKVTQ